MNAPHQAGLDRLKNGKIYIAGHRGMVGSALVVKSVTEDPR